MTKIEWTEKTWNPIVGCSLVSPGCTNCYAMGMAYRLKKIAEAKVENPPASHYFGTVKVVNSKPVWTGKVALAPTHILTEPLRRKKPTMWFVNSMGDLFHEDVPDEWIDQVFAVMALCPQHKFQILTKRAVRMRLYMEGLFRDDPVHRLGNVADELFGEDADNWLANYINGWSQPKGVCDDNPLNGTVRRWPLPNVWLGVSAEDQARANERIPHLLATPAAVRFVSCEPLLGPIDLTKHLWGRAHPCPECPKDMDCDCGLEPRILLPNEPDLRWVIVGGESGHGARPMHPDWARSLRDQCKAADVSFFMKQMDKKQPIPDDLMVREWPEVQS